MFRSSSRIFQVLSLILSVGVLMCQAQAQAAQGALRGRVLDPAGAPITGAEVTAFPDGRPSGFSTVSDQSGEFFLPLAAGSYRLEISVQGFEKSSQAVHVKQNGAESMEVTLQIAALHNAVTIIGSAYQVVSTASATKTMTPLRDIPQSITVVTQEQIRDQQMLSLGDLVRYVPGVTAHQGENNRDQIVIRGTSSSADFFLNGVRDDVQYYRDLYNLDHVEVLRGPNAMIFGRGGGGGVINRVTKEAEFNPLREITLLGGSYGNRRVAVDFDQPLNDKVAFRFNGMYENSDSFRDFFNLERYGLN